MNAGSDDNGGKVGLSRFFSSPLRLALAASLVANVFLAFTWVGMAARTAGDDAPVERASFRTAGAESPDRIGASREAKKGQRPRSRSRFVARLLQGASPELRALVEGAMAEQEAAFRAQREKVEALRRARHEAMLAEPFDVAELRRLQTQAAVEGGKLRALGYEVFTRVAERATPAQRAELVDLFKSFRSRRGRGPGGGRPDGARAPAQQGSE